MADATDATELERQSDELAELADFGPVALEVNEARVQERPRDATAWTRLGRCLEAAGRFEDAAEAFARAVTEGPKSPVAETHLKKIISWVKPNGGWMSYWKTLARRPFARPSASAGTRPVKASFVGRTTPAGRAQRLAFGLLRPGTRTRTTGRTPSSAGCLPHSPLDGRLGRSRLEIS